MALFLMVFQEQLPKQKTLDKFLKSKNTSITKMIALDVPNNELIERLLSRGKDSGRADDQNKEVITNRIKVYEDQTAILADYYRLQNKLVSVNGIGTIDEITQRLYISYR